MEQFRNLCGDCSIFVVEGGSIKKNTNLGIEPA